MNRSKSYYQIRSSVRWIFWSSVVVVSILAAYYLATHINWVGDHWCLKTIAKCYEGGL